MDKKAIRLLVEQYTKMCIENNCFEFKNPDGKVNADRLADFMEQLFERFVDFYKSNN